ncbi:putative beta-1,4-xylosyltransferase IRX9 [Morella rubra]|uniref:Glycosyltransferases n=1 Tax=Morella rubra TaxID=262757 RepID=A0A6A1WJQ8_9ROSI|nr:putative beta-1,4-xylosyltransferase IRX9 [Morella rubra]
MGSLERSKKKAQLWKKAVVHFSLCFVMGFFTGFAPTGKASVFTNHVGSSESSPQPVEVPHQAANINRSLIAEAPATIPTMPSTDSKRTKFSEDQEEEEEEEEEVAKLTPRRLVIIVTPTSSKDQFQGVLLRRLANTIRLVPPPLLWIVIEAQTDTEEVSKMLRKTGIMYRHLVSKKNFTDQEAEMDHQRNLALKHIENHRLSGIVHFAGISNVYDLNFFHHLRAIEVFGTWPIALLTPNKKKVIIEGPVCDSSQVIGWHLRKLSNESDMRPPIHISSFGFNSSILWDPERWGRPSALQKYSQNSMRFVKQVVLEDETKFEGIPPEDCSEIMLWHSSVFQWDSTS